MRVDEIPAPATTRHLAHPVHFVCDDAHVWPELRCGGRAEIAPSRLADLCVNGRDCWILRTCYELRQAGAAVTLSNRPRGDAINVAAIYDLGVRNRGYRTFLVVPRADGHDPHLANYTVLQNGVSPSALPHATIPHWLQPGILPRDPFRGEEIRTIAFKGAPQNLHPAFRDPAFAQALAGMGIAFDAGLGATDGAGRMGGTWADYSTTDLVLAVRNLTVYDAARKPASKLINAWWAEVPALLGPEPAYAEAGCAPQDYLVVRSPRDVIDAVQMLRATPGRYAAIVEAGRRARAAWTVPAMRARWIEVLNGPVAGLFERQSATALPTRLLTFVRMAVMERQSRRQHRARFSQGRRILDD